MSHFFYSTSYTALHSSLLLSVKNDTFQHSIKRHFLRVQDLGLAFLCRFMYKGVGFYVVEGGEKVMLIKAGVDISRLNRAVRKSLPRVVALAQEDGVELVITSTFEGDHGPGSLHYCNDAYDVRSWVSKNRAVLPFLREALGADFDVIDEGNHFHIEYDPS